MNKKSWIIIIAEALLFVFILGMTTRCSNDRISNLETNIVAYKDEIESVTLTNGELLASKQSLILSEQQVREELDLTPINLSSLSILSEKNIESNMDYMTIMYQNLKALTDAFGGE